ncbi:hypothetical protein ADK76_33870 [Streptomyces griseoflavus]|nr:hypothetical protein ADK76_33870 [Streptomyces griseoflavus]
MVALATTVATALTGCSNVTESAEKPKEAPDTREVSTARREVKGISKEILELMGLQGRVNDRGAGRSGCGDGSPSKYYVIHHPWSLSDVSIDDMKRAMERLKDELPRSGWNITSYGPDKSPSASLELVADSAKKKASVSIRLLDRTRRPHPGAPSMIYVDLTSECFQPPKGKNVDEY